MVGPVFVNTGMKWVIVCGALTYNVCAQESLYSNEVVTAFSEGMSGHP